MTGSDTIDAAVRAAELRLLTESTLADNWLPARLNALLAMDTRLCHVHIGICSICDHVMCNLAIGIRNAAFSYERKDQGQPGLFYLSGSRDRPGGESLL